MITYCTFPFWKEHKCLISFHKFSFHQSRLNDPSEGVSSLLLRNLVYTPTILTLFYLKFTLDARCIAPDRMSINICDLTAPTALTQDSRDSCIYKNNNNIKHYLKKSRFARRAVGQEDKLSPFRKNRTWQYRNISGISRLVTGEFHFHARATGD